MRIVSRLTTRGRQALPTQISVFTSERAWWRDRIYDDTTVRDDFPKATRFSSGRATVLTDGDGHLQAVARGGHRGSASDFSDAVTFRAFTPD